MDNGTNISKEQLWNDVLESIKVSVSSANFTTWFKQTHLSSLKKTEKRFIAEIGCTSSFIKASLETRYQGLIQDNLGRTLEAPCDVLFIVSQDPKAKTENPFSTPLFNQLQKQKPKKQSPEKLAKAGLRFGLTFKNFAVSSSNQMAWAAAEAVANEPASAYNPLFIWGGVGVGKTHLMNAVGYFLLKKDPEIKVTFCTGEQFTNDIVEGIRKKTTAEVRNKYRKAKALMIDDIQFIAGKDAVQEEFFHTFNSLVAGGAQIIMTSDQPPSEIAKLEERLQSRFEAGLIVDIAPPDFELRCAIVQIKAKERGLEIPMDLVQLIAGNIESARKILGFLVKLSSAAKLNNQPISEELIQSLLGKSEQDQVVSTKATPEEIFSAVSKYFSIGKRALLGSSRARPVSQPRQILMYLLRIQLQLPYQEVGRLVGGRDHTTVMHAVDKITHLASNNVQIREDIQGIKNML